MLPRILEKKDFDRFVSSLIGERRVVGPVAKGPKFVFDAIESPADLRLDYNVSMQSPRKYFLPPREMLLSFRKDPGISVKPVLKAEPLVIVGAHPCDVTAVSLFDAIFSQGVPDPHYLERRKNALIIGLDCQCPCDDVSFCHDMRSLYVTEGYDLFLTDLGDRFFVDLGTAEGKALLQKHASTRDVSKDDFEAKNEFLEKKKSNFHPRLPADLSYLPDVLEASYDSLIWEAIARRCYSCGSCNLVCPTCYCFDVTDEIDLDLSAGRRVRSWDSCQLDEFAEVAGGENFREARSARLRHRMFRKGKYILEKFGRPGCVGCGRCNRACTVDISILETYRQIAGVAGSTRT
ncbi:MAG: 4Fe-4S dicluster domain-containing protein [Planctomycetota bacterium]